MTRKTLQQLAAEANGTAEPKQVNGHPADVCPYCGCVLFVSRRMPGDREIIRYVECRNQNCGRRFLSSQPPAKLLRETGSQDDVSIPGKPNLTLRIDCA